MMHLYKLIKDQLKITKSELTILFANNLVLVNQNVTNKMSLLVDITDEIIVNGQRLYYEELDYEYYLYYKPRGIVCTNDRRVENNIVSYLNMDKRLFSIGRLDKESEGLIILTNDGALFNHIINSASKVEKEYLVTVDKVITEQFVDAMANGVSVLNRITKDCSVTKVSQLTFKITLTEGMNRQIRRMCKSFKYNVTRLERIRIKNICPRLEVGKLVALTDSQVEDLFSGFKDNFFN